MLDRMWPRTVAIALLLLAQWCVASPATDEAYSAGVKAYRLKNYTLAREQWEQVVAADDAHISAKNNLGYLLYYGLGGSMDRSRAISLWSSASRGGHAEAQWHLGIAAEQGLAVPKSDIDAFAWYRCAYANAKRRAAVGDAALEDSIAEDARRSLETVRSKLDDDDLLRAEAIANACIAEQSQTGEGLHAPAARTSGRNIKSR